MSKEIITLDNSEVSADPENVMVIGMVEGKGYCLFGTFVRDEYGEEDFNLTNGAYFKEDARISSLGEFWKFIYTPDPYIDN